MKLVVDTSVVVKWLNQTDEENIEKANKLLEDVLNGQNELIAPELAKYEMGNVLLLGKLLNPNEAKRVLETFYALPITFIAETFDLAKNSFSLASQLKITYYDASFLALAKQLNATLVTENIKHQGKAAGINVLALRDY